MNRKQQLIYQLQRELGLKKYALSSIKTYAACLSVFLDAMRGKPAPLNIEHIKTFLLTISNQNYHRQMVATIHHFYKLVLKSALSLDDIPYPRKTNYLRSILSVQEVYALMRSFQNIKHRCILQVMYSCALRTSEVVHIQLTQIDYFRSEIKIKDSKGFKDRFVPVAADKLQLIKTYLHNEKDKPKKWLFEGQHHEQYSTRSLQEIFYQGCKRVGIRKDVTPYCLRHSRATHLKEADVDIKDIKDLLGHSHIKTTEIYTRMATKSLSDRIARADKIINDVFTSQLQLT